MNFGEAFEKVKQGNAMRLPSWSSDVIIKAQFPDEHSKMTAPYLYVESRFGKVPWKETMIELFSNNWKVLYLSSRGNILVDQSETNPVDVSDDDLEHEAGRV